MVIFEKVNLFNRFFKFFIFLKKISKNPKKQVKFANKMEITNLRKIT